MPVLAVKLPDVGEGVTEAELAEWNIKVGDIVQEDDVLGAIMTDKATVEIPSLYAGKVVELGGEVGQVLPVGADFVLIETQDVTIEETDQTPSDVSIEKQPASDSKPVLPKPVSSTTPPPVATVGAPRPEGQAPLASPSVRARARSAGIDLRQVAGTGPSGRILHEDLDLVFAKPQGQTAISGRSKRHGSQEIKVIGLRRKISERMALANARIPHITVVEEVDVTELEVLRTKLNDGRGDKPKLTLLPFVIAALERTLRDHPEMNAYYDDEAGIVTRHSAVHVGMATMTENGLVVPVLRHVEALGLFDTAAEISRLSEAARIGKAARDELTGSTITVTSLGPLGGVATTPIINHPEVAILGINKMAMRPMWDGSQFQPRKMMNLSSSFDHRVIDGWDAAVFVQRIKELLETPAMIFVEG